MAFRPVFLSELVRANPPFPAYFSIYNDPMKRALALRNATLGCALYLAESHDYVLMQDNTGGVWVQHKRSSIIVAPPEGLIFRVKGESLPYQRWLSSMHKVVRQQGRTGLDPNLSFRCGVERLYSDHFKDKKFTKHFSIGVLSKRSALKALNPYIAHRTWISKFLGGLGFTQMSISSLTKGLWKRETRKALWSNIARLYTYARNEDQQGLVLGDFIMSELMRNNQDRSPRTFLLACGIDIDGMREKLDPDYCKFDAQITTPNISAPIEPVYPRTTMVSEIYFKPPQNIKTSEQNDFGATPIPYTNVSPMNILTNATSNSIFYFEEFTPEP